MTKKRVKKKTDNAVLDGLFKSLVFPIKKRWIVERPTIKASKCHIKKAIKAVSVGMYNSEAAE